MAKHFLDWSVFTDPHTGLDLLRRTIPQTNKFDAMAARNVKGTFTAVIISDVMPLSAAESKGTPGGNSASDNASLVAKYYFKARIDPRMNPISPHVMLEDPCDLSTSADPYRAMSVIMMHTTFIYTTAPGAVSDDIPAIGDIIEVGLFDGDAGGYDLQYGIFLRKVAPGTGGLNGKTDAESLQVSCAAMKDIFDNLPMSPIQSGKAQVADYVSSTGVTQLINNGQLPDALLSTTNPLYATRQLKILGAIKLDFDTMAQAYYDHFKEKFPLTDVYRPYSLQVDVKRRKPNLAATPGTSNHGWGAAIDWGSHGFTTDAYKWFMENGSKYNWTAPCWARERGGPWCKGCGDGCGTKEEHWHIESTRKSSFIQNIRSAKKAAAEAVAAAEDGRGESHDPDEEEASG